jgi:UDP-glucose-4-epimerase GalE
MMGGMSTSEERRGAVLVTGGAGYIGSHTVRLLRELGRPVVVLDNLSTGREPAVLGAPLVVGEITDAALVRQAVQDHGATALVHFAAYKAAGESMLDPGKYFGNNVCGSLALFEAARAAGVRHVVFSSTCAVYGTPEVVPVAETAPLHPESPYGESKLMVERILHWLDRAHGLRSVSLRYFNAAGASADAVIGEDWTTTYNLVPAAIKSALERGPRLQVFGNDYPTADGTAIRDYIHVDDLADAHVRALDHLERGGPSTSINLGTGVGSSVLDVIHTLEEVSGVQVRFDTVDRRPGDPAALHADNRLAAEVLGWVPSFGLPEILRSAWQWHTSQLG